MTEKITTRRRTVKQTSENKPSDKTAESSSSLLEKVFPSLVVVSVSAIFYFTGWVYIAHWYSYYGIDATLISIPIQIILLHGFPGILVLGASGLLAILGATFYKNILYRSPLQVEDVPTIIIIAYLVSLGLILVITFTIILIAQSAITIPVEVLISSLGILLIIIVYRAQYEIRNAAFYMQSTVAGMIITLITKKGIIEGFEFLKDLSTNKAKITELMEIIREKTPTEMDEVFQDATERVARFFENSWRVWITAILLFYFLISVSISAILGEWDASRGARFLIGNWHIPEVSLFSTSGIPALETFESKISSGFEYKPLGLLSSNDKVYYLVDWKGSDYYRTKPNVYIIPRSDSLSLNLIVSPYVHQAPTPTATNTIAPTLSPPATVAVTSTP